MWVCMFPVCDCLGVQAIVFAGNMAFLLSPSIEDQVTNQNNQELDLFLSRRSGVSRNVHVHDVYVREKEIVSESKSVGV